MSYSFRRVGASELREIFNGGDFEERLERVWFVPHFGGRSVDRIRQEDVADLVRRMEAGGAGRRAKYPGRPEEHPQLHRDALGALLVRRASRVGHVEPHPSSGPTRGADIDGDPLPRAR